MMTISILCLALSVLIILFGMRGRVSARGLYCRACRFDLSGIAHDQPNAKCPECGRLLRFGKAPRQVVRRRMRLVVAFGIFGFLISGGYLAILLSGSAGKVYRVMPNGVVLNASIWGSEDALDVLMERIGNDDQSIDEPAWDQLIDHALIRLDAIEIDWNPHWGEILYVAACTDRMNVDELQKYIEQISTLSMSVKGRMLGGEDSVAVTLELRSHRASASTGGQLPYRYLLKLKQSGIDGWVNEDNASFYTGFEGGLPLSMSTPPAGGWSSTSVVAEVGMTRDGELLEIDETARMVVETSLEVVSRDGGDALFSIDQRFTADIRVFDPDVELVGRISPSEPIDTLAERITLHPFKVTHPEEWDAQAGSPNSMISYHIELQDTPHPIAYTIYFLSANGEELQLDEIVAPPSSGSHGLGRSAKPGADDPEQAARIRRIAEEMLEQGKATLILRVTPELANDVAGSGGMLDLDILVRDVGVEPQSGDSISSWSSVSPDGVKGTALEREGVVLSDEDSKTDGDD